MAELAERVEKALASLGFAKEKRKFTPHLTIGRWRQFKRSDKNLTDALAKWKERDFGGSTVHEVVLFQSILESRRRGVSPAQGRAAQRPMSVCLIEISRRRTTMDVNREKAIDLAVSQIERQFGKGAIMKLGEGGVPKDHPVISSGSLGLDIALGIGGVPRGRVIEIYGPESSGKTTLALHIVAEAQKLGGMGAFIDAEHALDIGYAKKLGVKTDDLLISQPDHGEQALEIAETLVRSGAIDVLVIDSVAALVPKAEIEGEMGDAHMGLQARLMSQALRKLTGDDFTVATPWSLSSIRFA